MSEIGPPIVRTFRRLLTLPRLILKRNWAYQKYLSLLQRLNCMENCDGGTISDTINVAATKVFLRGPDPWAKKTIIVNTGNSDAVILEAGIISTISHAQSSQEIPGGKLTMEALCLAGSTTLQIQTARRCPCGDAYLPPYGATIEPIGGDLI